MKKNCTQALGELEGRLAEVEDKLKGVYNLSGKMITLDRLAAEFEIETPDLEVSGHLFPIF